MEKSAFINRIRSLSNIDGYWLPELSVEQQTEFLRDPIGYFLMADESQSDAIMREIERRQVGSLAPAEKPAKPSRSRRVRVEGQREMLLPIPGKKVEVDLSDEEKSMSVSPSRLKAG